MDYFLDSKTSITPLIAGTMTTIITGTVAREFDLPGNWTAITVSLLLGLIVSIEKGTPIVRRILYYVLNSVTILTVSIGINTAGVAATKSDEQQQYEQRWVPPESESKDFFTPWF